MFDEIVNALHICTNDEEGCEDCPFYMSRRVDGLSCYDQLKREAANAIEALKEQLQAKDIDIDGLETVNADLEEAMKKRDVRPVVHGKWERKRDKCGSFVSCSVCHTSGWHQFVFCPYCGADMQKEGGEEDV